MTTLAKSIELLRDESGRAPLKIVFGSCLLALALAISSPAFEANPLIGKTVHEIAKRLPATLATITDALRG